MASKHPHLLLGGASGIITSSTPEQLTSLFKHLKTLATPVYGIDTAAVYAGGKSESLLGEGGIGNADLVLDTKVLMFPPGASGPSEDRKSDGGPLSKANVLRSSKESLERLKNAKVRCLYAHAPDKVTPAAETVAGFGEVLKNGEAEVWGISNYSPDQLREVIAECEKQNVPKPKLYQGQYHAINRKSEEELFPLLREHGIVFYAYSPTAGGVLTDRVASSGGKELPTRVQNNPAGLERHKERYGKPGISEGLQKLHEQCQKQGSSVQGASQRWLIYHSPLGAGDAIIVGARNNEQIEDTAEQISKGPLDDAVVKAFEDVWASLKDVTPAPYFRG